MEPERRASPLCRPGTDLGRGMEVYPPTSTRNGDEKGFKGREKGGHGEVWKVKRKELVAYNL